MIDLAGITRTALAVGFDVGGQLLRPCVYHSVNNPAYDAATGVQTPDEDTVSVSPMVLAFKRKEIDGQIVRQGDERVLIRATEMGEVEPGEDDYLIETATSIRRDVRAVTFDPTRELYTLHVRRSAPEEA